ncbi:MAG: helix-turn-helix domain-containing protein [Bdellovibrionales bacterium]|nr:helix-turn-helix domain-containing protein [Bdellovibrionales bacterium]
MSDRNEGQTYYEILEVKPTAGPADIYAAYQRARSTYSPSSPALYSMFTPEEAQALMALIEEAYQTLSHQARRREYDVKIGLGKAPGAKPTSAYRPEPASREEAKPGRTPVGSVKTDAWVGPVKVSTRKHEDLPSGFARTKFTVYEVKSDIENEIENVAECDGQFLQKIRLYRGVTLDQMSDEIRVIKSTLVALEANDLDALPVAVFTRGFVVQFARALGLDERKISDAYMKFFRAKKT